MASAERRRDPRTRIAPPELRISGKTLNPEKHPNAASQRLRVKPNDDALRRFVEGCDAAAAFWREARDAALAGDPSALEAATRLVVRSALWAAYFCLHGDNEETEQ